MRTAPLVTAPRYQEDYLLAGHQLKAMDVVHAREARERNKKLAIGAAVTVGVVVAVAAYLKFRQTSAK